LSPRLRATSPSPLHCHLSEAEKLPELAAY
jgi:hypothetical protein